MHSNTENAQSVSPAVKAFSSDPPQCDSLMKAPASLSGTLRSSDPINLHRCEMPSDLISKHLSTREHKTMPRKSLSEASAIEDEPVTPLVRQPETTPISPDQLAIEIKAIYAGLVMVEAKCIKIDAAQSVEPRSPLTEEQWQALVALHRTLLFEHHDFLMATQHPNATAALKGLAIKYSMPARMWKHGVHAFLEVLRHRRPASQEFMLTFIDLAYQIMASLFETVPTFKDVWIECLGDLARYRMAIEEDRLIHAAWAGVAAQWYTTASDRLPSVGRPYHHLGVLERPSLRKVCFYVKSLTCTVPFVNARDSLKSLCGPIVQNEKTIESSTESPEARIVTFWALICCSKPQVMIEEVGDDALRLLCEQPAGLQTFGADLSIICIAGLFERGHPLNPLWRLYVESGTPNPGKESFRPKSTPENSLLLKHSFYAQMSSSLSFAASFCYRLFNMVLRSWQSEGSARGPLSFVHIMLVWQHSLHQMRTDRSNPELLSDAFTSLIEPSQVIWAEVAAFLNSLSEAYPVNAFGLAHGRVGTFPQVKDFQPLPEDYMLRGLIWTQRYFPLNHFTDKPREYGHVAETETIQLERARRVQWLALYLAYQTEYLVFDENTSLFAAAGIDHSLLDGVINDAETTLELSVAKPHMTATTDVTLDELSMCVARSGVSIRVSSGRRTSSSWSLSGSDDGFHIVTHSDAEET